MALIEVSGSNGATYSLVVWRDDSQRREHIAHVRALNDAGRYGEAFAVRPTNLFDVIIADRLPEEFVWRDEALEWRIAEYLCEGGKVVEISSTRSQPYTRAQHWQTTVQHGRLVEIADDVLAARLSALGGGALLTAINDGVSAPV